MKCKKCGNDLPENAKFCFECGAKVEQELVCATCGAKMCAEYKFCMECGNMITCSGGKEMTAERVEQDDDIDWYKALAEMFPDDSEACSKFESSEKNTYKSYDTYWSRMYGSKDYVEYKGNIYCMVKEDILTGKKSQQSYESKRLIACLGINNGTKEIIKEIKDCDGIFTIYDDRLYYVVHGTDDRNKYCALIHIFDINTKEETIKSITLKNPDSEVVGVFRGHNREVYIKQEYDYKKDAPTYFISDLEGQSKQKLGTDEFYEIVAYNECYVYYRERNGSRQDKKLYAVNLDTFEVIKLSSKLTQMENGSFYGVDPREDVIYIAAYDEPAILSINMSNEIVEKLVIPKLPDYITLSKSHSAERLRCMIAYGIYQSSDESSKNGFFYSGKNWILKINPEDVEEGTRSGIIVFNNEEKEVGTWLKYRTDSYVHRSRMLFVFPTALTLMDEVVDEHGIVQTHTISMGTKAWHGSVISITESGLKDSWIDLYDPM